MLLWLRRVILLFFVVIAGCSGPRQADVIFFVPGVAGDGLWYNGLRDGFKDAGVTRQMVSIGWGAPLPLANLNYSNKGVHDDAERHLANTLVKHREQFPAGRIDLLAHSAGCGVVLGALCLLPPEIHIDHIILLAPSVSPTYDIVPPLRRCQAAHVFYSKSDNVFLDWRTSRFGTYDRIKTKAAGNLGFDVRAVPPELLQRLSQHEFAPADKQLSNDGGHFGSTARRFIASQVAPLLK